MKSSSFAALLLVPSLLSAEVSPRQYGEQALAPAGASFKGNAASVKEAHEAGLIRRRDFFISLGIAAIASKAEAKTPDDVLWPQKMPPWTVQPGEGAFPLPADTDVQVEDEKVPLALEQVYSGFVRYAAPESRQKELFAFVLLSIRSAKDVDAPMRIQILNNLLQVVTGEGRSFLWNYEELLHQVYGAIYGEKYKQFQQVYKYHPVSVDDLIWLNALFRDFSEPQILGAQHYFKQLQEAGCVLGYPFLPSVIRWSQQSKDQRGNLLKVAAQVSKVAPGDRYRTAKALEALQSLANPSGAAALQALEQPGVFEFVHQLDDLFRGIPVQLDQLMEILPYHADRRMQLVLSNPAFFRDATPAPTKLALEKLIRIAENPISLSVVRLLKDDFGYNLRADDVTVLGEFPSAEDLRQKLNLAKSVFGGLPPITGAALVALRNLSTMSDENRDRLRRIFKNSEAPASADILQSWVSAAYGWPSASLRGAPRSESVDPFDKIVPELKALGWKPGTDSQAALLWPWISSRTSLDTLQSFYREKGMRLRTVHDLRVFQGLSSSEIATMRALPRETYDQLYVQLPREFLAAIKNRPGSWNFFIQLLERGYLSGKIFGRTDPSDWSTISDRLYGLLDDLRAEVQKNGWGSLERLQKLSSDPAVDILVGQAVQPQMRLIPDDNGQTYTSKSEIHFDWGLWLTDSIQAQAKKLYDRLGYRLTVKDEAAFVWEFADREDWIARAERIQKVTGKVPTAALAPIIRDPHLERLYSNKRAQKLLKELTEKGYVWNAVDTEFIYHLAQRWQWRRRIAKLKVISADLHDIKYAYLEDQLKNRLELRDEIRKNITDDLANPYTEFGGIYAFKPNGDLVLVPLPSRFQLDQRTQMNGNYRMRPFDEANLEWYAGRFFAMFHNHAISDVELSAHVTPGDRALAKEWSDMIGLHIVTAATSNPMDPLTLYAYTAGSAERQVGHFYWTEFYNPVGYLRQFFRRIFHSTPQNLSHPLRDAA